MKTRWSLIVVLGISLVRVSGAEPTLENLFDFDPNFDDRAEVRSFLNNASLGIRRISQIGNRHTVERLQTLLDGVLALPPQLFVPEEALGFSIALKALLQRENLNASDMSMVGVLGESPAPFQIQASDLTQMDQKLLEITKRCLRGQSAREQAWLLLQMTEDRQSAPPPQWVAEIREELPAGQTLVDNLKLVIAHALARARPKACEQLRSLEDCASPQEELVAGFTHETLINYFEIYREMLLALPTGRLSLFSDEETNLLAQSFRRQAFQASSFHWQSHLEALWVKLFGKQTRRFWPECSAAVVAAWSFWRTPVPQRPRGSQP